MTLNTAENLFSSTVNYIQLDHIAIQDAINKFSIWKNEGVIISPSDFYDIKWFTTDKYHNIGLIFDFDAKAYHKYYEHIINLAFPDFLLSVKAFLVSLFGKNALKTMSAVLLDLRHVFNSNPAKVINHCFKYKLSLPKILSLFISLLPVDEDDKTIEELLSSMDLYSEDNIRSGSSDQRTLAEFDTYFLFHEIMTDFWSSDISETDRLFYYPLYLWWSITGVVPSRPHEFLLTSRDCLEYQNGKCVLKLRKNDIKGGHESISYNLDDYSEIRCYISDKLAADIQLYIQKTSSYNNTDIDTLLIADTHYLKWNRKKHNKSRFFTYINLATVLRYFYKDVVCAQYGYKVSYENEDRMLDDGYIGYIHLGDTRHISLINLMNEGGNPVTAMLLAGHKDPNMASHYYSNLKSLIKCRTYRYYHKYIGSAASFSLSSFMSLPVLSRGTLLSDGSICFSDKYPNKDYSDCYHAVGPNGEIAHCQSCDLHRQGGNSYLEADDLYTKRLANDCTLLANAVKLVRQEKGYVEDIGQVLLNVQASSRSYESYLLYKTANDKSEE